MLQTTWQYFKLTTWYFVGIRSCKGKKQTIFEKIASWKDVQKVKLKQTAE